MPARRSGAAGLGGRSTRSEDDLAARRRPGTTPPSGDIRMNWFILVLAGLFEIGWAIGLKYTEGFTKLWPSVGTAAAMIISIGLLGVAMKTLPVGTAYAIWVGVGAVGTVILGIVLLGEPMNAARLISVALIVAGLVGLKLASPA
jgi:quaternary ammonium compound-resistance protein SugE